MVAHTDRRGHVLLLTGLSGSGKSTLARALAQAMRDRAHVYVVDGDELRAAHADLGFSRGDRHTQLLRAAALAQGLAASGALVVCALIAPYAASREAFCQHLEAHCRVSLIYLDCPLAVCVARDPKGLYAAARAGGISQLTGHDDPYEVPTNVALRLQTNRASVDECVDGLLRYLR